MKNRCRFITLNKTKMNQQLKTSPKESTRVGLLIVGIGGNNGSTLATTMLLKQQRGIAHERLYGSVSQSGSVSDASGKVHSIKDVTEPILKDLSEFIAVGGWDVRSDVSTLNDAVHNADVIPLKTQEILSKIPQMSDKTSVMPGVWLASSTFIEKEVREECVFEELLTNRYLTPEKPKIAKPADRARNS